MDTVNRGCYVVEMADWQYTVV